MSEAVKGFWALVAACAVWGLSGIYYKALGAVPPLEVLAHRTLWSVVFLCLVLAVQGQLGALKAALTGQKRLALCAAALTISANWFMFIWSVQSGHALEASLGYYIFPLVSVALGRIFLGERLSRGALLAVALAALGVLVLGLGLGVTPWVALALALTFGAYGLIKKQIKLGAVVSVAAETALLAPFALIVLAGRGAEGAFGADLTTSLLLAFSGVMTGGPLILFSYAAQRVRLGTVGLVQYLNPSLQLMVALLIFGETGTLWHAIALPIIWAGLAVYSAAAWRGR